VSDQLPTHVVVAAMLRRVNDAGGLAMVRARGDRDGGTVLILLDDIRALERGHGANGAPVLVEARRADASEPLDDYWRRRRARDPDLWVVELSGAGAADAAALLA
jgi:hypothetical protein